MNNSPETNNEIPVLNKKHNHSGSAWWPLMLILVGVILLIQNLHLANIHFQWWALFIFIPVFASVNSAWKEYQNSGRLNTSVRSSFGSAVLVGTLAVILMFGLDWARFWPLMVMATGFSIFLGGLSIIDPQENSRITVWSGIAAWVGLAGIVLGFGFLAQYLPISSIKSWLVSYPDWWSIPILVAGLGILMNAVVYISRNQWRLNWQSWSMLLVALFVLAVAVMAWFALDWQLLFPIVLIACGIMILLGILRKR
jgi:hypothetical protein